MKPNEFLRSRRESLGLTDGDVAARAGMTIHEYGDIEQHEKESTDVVSLRQLRRVLSVLESSIPLFLGSIEIAPPASTQEIQYFYASRADLIKKSREAMGIAPKDLAETLGYDVDAINALENDPTFLDEWPLELIGRLAQELRLPLRVLTDSS